MKDKQTLPGWGVNRVKVNKSFSEETLCFRAEVTLDEKVVGHAFNEGHGGPTHVTLTEAALKKIAKPAGIEDHVDRLVDNEVALQDLARTHKRWMKEIMVKGRVFILNHDELKAWEAGTDHQESSMPPFRAYSNLQNVKVLGPAGEHFTYGEGSAKALWDMMVQCHYKWKALDDARTDAMLKEYEEKLKARVKYDCPPASPQMPDGY
jgi:hypothetical protein